MGAKLHAVWLKASVDLPSLIVSYKPQLGDLAKKVVGILASMGGGLLGFVFSFIVAGIMMAWAHRAPRAPIASPCASRTNARGWR